MGDANAGNTAILIVSFNGRRFLPECLSSLFLSADAPPADHVIVVDNASSDGSWEWLEENHPAVTRLRLATNTGFAGGNNAGWDVVRKKFPQVKYIALLNQDTIVAPGWLEALVKVAESDAAIASVQSKLRLHPDTDLINSAGNESHYLGFGFVTGYRQKDCGQFDTVRDLAYGSGAAVLVRVEAIGRDKLFDETYFSYLEDAELGWHLRLAGHRNVICPTSVVYHRYEFTRNPQTYHLLERNRWRLILTYYRIPTLLLLSPALLVMELGLLFYFLKTGALREKLKSWDVFADLSSIAAERKAVQGQRKLSDRELCAPFISAATFPEVRNVLLTCVGNPILTIYWQLVRLLLWW